MLYIKKRVPFRLYEIDLNVSDKELVRISNEARIGLSLEEMKRIKEYFKLKNRNPNDIELQALGQAWSEHCSYKTSKPFLKKFIFNIHAPQNLLVIKEDAGVVEFDKTHAYVVAFESHNHPSTIEPYGGAATGIGGIVRDVVCMGSQPIALIDPLFFGPLAYPHEKLPAGVKHPKFLFEGVVAGIRDYGNRIGIPTCAGMIYFDETYLGNCVVNVGCVGIVKKNEIVRSKVKKPDDRFILIGGRTGRDGIHGVTFASAELTKESETESRSAVQIGDPITKEPLMHVCLEANKRKLLNGMKDLGGGGLSCAIGEMTFAAGYGAQIDLDKVPLKEKNLAPWEIWVSESQERMMLAVSPRNVKKVLELCKLWDVPATVIGKAEKGKKLRVNYKGYKIFDLDTDFFVNAPLCYRKYVVSKPKLKIHEIEEPKDYNEVILKILSSLNIASKELVIRQYDHEVRASTIIKPLQGKINYYTHGDAVVIKPLENSFRGLVITSDVNPSYVKLDAFWGSTSAIDEVCRNLAAVGATPHSFADCLNFGNPEKPDRLGMFCEVVKGLGWVAKQLGVPFVSGNVSFYNESSVGYVSTPTILGIGIVQDVRKVCTVDLKKTGNLLYLIGETRKELGGSEYYKLMNVKDANVPKVFPEILKKSINGLTTAINQGYVEACHDVADGGIAACIAEMCIGGDIGATINIEKIADLRLDYKLFSESNTRWVVEIKPKHAKKFERLMKNVRFFRFGKVGGKNLVIKDKNKVLANLSIEKIRQSWGKGVSKYFR